MSTSRSLVLSLALSLLAPALAAQTARPTTPIRYEITFPNRVHHEGEVVIRYTAVPAGALPLAAVPEAAS